MMLKVVGIMLIVMGVMTGIFYWYYTDSQAKIATLHENTAKLETAVGLVSAQNEQMQESFERQTVLQSAMIKRFQGIETQLGGLDETLREHDLQFLALKKPDRIEKIINRATSKLWGELEAETAQ